MSVDDEFPLEDHTSERTPPHPDPQQRTYETPPGQWLQRLTRLGLHGSAILTIVLVGWVARFFFIQTDLADVRVPQAAALAAPIEPLEAPALQEEEGTEPSLPSLPQGTPFALGIPRLAMLHTTIPTRPRVDVITYTVQAGDTVFGIAEFFGLRPETIFWGNQDVLNDDPHKLFPGQVLNILPVDGVYHRWSAGENLTKVAEFYKVDPQAILEYPGNHFDLALGEEAVPEIEPGTWLIVPDGQREFVDFGPPRITRSNPAVARTYGPGHCGEIVDGAVGSGTFIWPTTATYLSGYDYNPAANHPGIDIAGDTGNPIYAADTGVVVYAGWSYFGYGNLVVIDHGQWQTLYAHLSDYYVTCGQSVFQGATIAAMGNTGNSSGPHLHFELMYLSAKVNPWDYLSP